MSRDTYANLLYLPKLPHSDPHLKLPLSARRQLQGAAAVEIEKAAGCSERRAVAIDETIKNLRKRYPDAFWPLDKRGYPIKG